MNPGIIAVSIPIVAIVMGIGIGMLTVYFNYRKRKEMFALYHQERMAAIEKGIDLPPLPDAFFAEDGKPRSPHRGLAVGLVWLFVGLALLVALYFNHEGEAALYALIPVAVGIAYLIYYFVVGKKEAEDLEAERKAKAADTSRRVTI